MSIQNQRQLHNTRQKLKELEEHRDAIKRRPVTNAHTRELTIRSFSSLIKQLKEEIARYETRATQPAKSD